MNYKRPLVLGFLILIGVIFMYTALMSYYFLREGASLVEGNYYVSYYIGIAMLLGILFFYGIFVQAKTN